MTDHYSIWVQADARYGTRICIGNDSGDGIALPLDREPFDWWVVESADQRRSLQPMGTAASNRAAVSRRSAGETML